MGNWKRRDEGSPLSERAGFPRKANPDRAARSTSPSPANRGDSLPYPERRNRDVDRNPLTDEQRGLATRYMPMARTLAKRYRFRWQEREDFEATAYLALVEAARTFDPARKVNFATYARHRIRGALQDYQRLLMSEDWRGDRAISPIFTSLGEDTEAHGKVLGIEPERPIGTEVESTEAVEEWLRRLPRAHAVACRHIYIHGKSQDEVAALVGCSKSFLSRLHREAISWLIQDYQAARAGQERDP
ncbi:MAG: sigma-70 family RNA polymerase sigma factor [Isosphaerales bacterium]